MKAQTVIEIDVRNNNTAKVLNDKIKDGWTLISLTPILSLKTYGREAAASATTELIALFEKETSV